MSIKVSIILISYNKYPQNLFTLYSLHNQTYDRTRMEVILVDDNSTDNTVFLKDYAAPFPFKYLRSERSLGRAGAKNFGLKEAEGEIIIFLDGEIMADPSFVHNHVRHYSTEKEIVVSGTSGHYGTYSVIYPKFNKRQMRQLHSLIKNRPVFLKRLSRRLGLTPEHVRDIKKFMKYIKKNNNYISMWSKKDILAQRFKNLSFPLPSFPQVMEQFDGHLTGYHLPWTFFITRNVSVRKRAIHHAGLFNEEFKGWGYEDWELGCRLYKNGVKFIEDRDIISYHQEHPFSKKDRKKEQMRNYFKFIRLHPDIEVCALTLTFLNKRSLPEINELVNDCYLLKNEFPHQYVYFKNAFIKLTEQIPLLIFEGKPVKDLLFAAGAEKELKGEGNLYLAIESLRKTGKFVHFLSAFDLLINL